MTVILSFKTGKFVVFWDGSEADWTRQLHQAGIAERTDLCVLAEQQVEPGLHWIVLGSRRDAP